MCLKSSELYSLYLTRFRGHLKNVKMASGDEIVGIEHSDKHGYMFFLIYTSLYYNSALLLCSAILKAVKAPKTSIRNYKMSCYELNIHPW